MDISMLVDPRKAWLRAVSLDSQGPHFIVAPSTAACIIALNF